MVPFSNSTFADTELFLWRWFPGSIYDFRNNCVLELLILLPCLGCVDVRCKIRLQKINLHSQCTTPSQLNWCFNWKRANFVSIHSVRWFIIPCLKVCTALSTKPFKGGWYIAELGYVSYAVPSCENLEIVAIIKAEPLSDTNTSGRPSTQPWIAKVVLSLSGLFP